MKINRLFPFFLVAAIGAALVYIYPAVADFLIVQKLMRISHPEDTAKTLGIIGYVLMILPMLLAIPTLKSELEESGAVKYIVLAGIIGIIALIFGPDILKKAFSSHNKVKICINLIKYFLVVALPLIFSAIFLARMSLSGKSWAVAGYYIGFFVLVGLSILWLALSMGDYRAMPLTWDTINLIDYIVSIVNLLAAFFIVLGWFLTAKGALAYDREFLAGKPAVSSFSGISTSSNLSEKYGEHQIYGNPSGSYTPVSGVGNPNALSDTSLEQIIYSSDPAYTNDYKHAVSEVLFSRKSPVIFSKLEGMTNDQLSEIIANSSDYFSGYVKAAQVILDSRK